MEETKVIFRKFKDDGDIIAIFPEIPSSENYYNCQSYQHVGQHGGCDPHYLIYEATKKATPEEYKELYDELTNLVGYNLKVIH